MTDIDVFVSGGGISGLVATLAFEKLGCSVLCVDPTPPPQSRLDKGADLRTTAFLQPSQLFLDKLGLWDALVQEAMPLEIMRIIDAGGAGDTPAIRVSKDFVAKDISELPFGWNVPNWFSRKTLEAAIAKSTNATFRPGLQTERLFTRENEARITLSDGSRYRAKLVIGADGRESFIRRSAGIGTYTKRFAQKAMAFAVTHPIPHDNVSTEIHRSGGPFTLVPLPDYDGQPSSAVVWMETARKAAELMGLSETEFEKEMTARSCHVLGPLSLATRRSLWPMLSQLSEQLVAQRVALVAEAAHVIPPIGAQGLNMSLGDIEVLSDLAAQAEDIGAADLLHRYEKKRMPDLKLRVAGVSALNMTSMSGHPFSHDLRAKGIEALHQIAPVRKSLMRLGLGMRS